MYDAPFLIAMNPILKETAQFLALVVTVTGGLIAAFKTIYEMKQSREQRTRELRWRQANIAKELLDEIFSHHCSERAALMLDWYESKRLYEMKPEQYEWISYDEAIAALQKDQLEVLEEKDFHIRECFDFFLYFIDRIEHYIEIGLISFEDIEAPLRPYAKKMSYHKQIFDDFMLRQHEYELARKLLDRYIQHEQNSNTSRLMKSTINRKNKVSNAHLQSLF